MNITTPLVRLLRFAPTFVMLFAACSWIGPEREWNNPHDDENPARPLPPVLTDLPNDTTAFINDTCTFTVRAVDDSGTELIYNWNIDDANSTHNIPRAFIKHSWKSGDTGEHIITVFATNTWSMPSDTHTFTVTVLAGAPGLVSTFDDTTVSQLSTIQKTFAARDSNGEIALYRWSIGEKVWNDSSVGPDPVDVSFSNPDGGALPVAWEALDDDFLAVRDSFTIFFNRGPDTAYVILPDTNEIPFESFDVLQNNGSIRLQYHASDPDSSNDSITYTFTVVATQSDTLYQYNGPDDTAVIENIIPSAEYEWYLRAEDLFGDTITATGTITAASPPAAPEGMVLIKSRGEFFRMGQSGFDPSEEPIHAVGFDYSFWIDSTEITNAMYAEAMNLPSPDVYSAHYPVSGISWYDAVLYCNAKSVLDGRDTVYIYSENTEGVLTGLTVNLTANGYRLPSEAEWEYACKKDSLTLYYWGNDNYSAKYHAWFIDNSADTTHQAALLEPNHFGLYDMAGNVWEWCNDWFEAEYYSSTPMLNPFGPDEGTYKAIRGGSYHQSLYFLQAGTRGYVTPITRDPTIGFRTVIAAYQQP